jgi:hypothetical protein
LAGHVLRWRQDAAFQNRSSPAEQRSGRAWRTPNVCLISASGGRDPSISSRLMLLPSPPPYPPPQRRRESFLSLPPLHAGEVGMGQQRTLPLFPFQAKINSLPVGMLAVTDPFAFPSRQKLTPSPACGEGRDGGSKARAFPFQLFAFPFSLFTIL